MNKKVWTIHCLICKRVLGISIKDLQKKEVYCLRCAKKVLVKKENE